MSQMLGCQVEVIMQVGFKGDHLTSDLLGTDYFGTQIIVAMNEYHLSVERSRPAGGLCQSPETSIVPVCRC